MSVDAPLALTAVALIAAGTPRQAASLFGGNAGPTTRRLLRSAGWLLLACSLALVLAGPDRARRCIGWIGLLGIDAVAVALLLSVRASARAGVSTRPVSRKPALGR